MKFKLNIFKKKTNFAPATQRQVISCSLHKNTKILSALVSPFSLVISYAEPEFENKAFLKEVATFEFVIYKNKSTIEDLHDLTFLTFSHGYFIFLKVVP